MDTGGLAVILKFQCCGRYTIKFILNICLIKSNKQNGSYFLLMRTVSDMHSGAWHILQRDVKLTS